MGGGWSASREKACEAVYDGNGHILRISETESFKKQQGTQAIPVLTEKYRHFHAQSGMGDRHHLHKDGQDAYVSDSNTRLAQQIYSRVGTVRQSGYSPCAYFQQIVISGHHLIHNSQ